MTGGSYPICAYPSDGIEPLDSVAVLLEYEDALSALSVELVLVVEVEVFVSEVVA